MKVGIIFIGTNKYADFFQLYYPACEEYLAPTAEKHYIAFTDQGDNEIFQKDRVTVAKIKHYPWPYITLLRFKFISKVLNILEDMDYCLFIDADLIPQSPISLEEIFGDKSLVGVCHPGFINSVGPFETNIHSTAGVLNEHLNLSTYCQGCLWGGRKNDFFQMVKVLSERVDKDLSNNLIAAWHDESHMNRYFAERRNQVHTLHPGFATPEQGYDHIKKEYETKMLHLHKDMKDYPRFEGAGHGRLK